MADDSEHRDESHQELPEMPQSARLLMTIGMAQKTPGRCACGEHPDPHAPGDPSED